MEPNEQQREKEEEEEEEEDAQDIYPKDSVEVSFDEVVAKGSGDNNESNTNNKNDSNTNNGNNDSNNNSSKKKKTTLNKKSKSIKRTIDFLKDDPSEMTYSRRLALYLMKRYKWYNPRLGEEGERHQRDMDPSMGEFRTPEGHPVDRTVEEHPSLEVAWAYFEHVTLPRYISKEYHCTDEPVPVVVQRNADDDADLEQNDDDDEENDEQEVEQSAKHPRRGKAAEPGENTVPTKLYHPFWTAHGQLGDFGLGTGLYFTTQVMIIMFTVLAGIINIPTMLYYISSDYNSGEETNLSIGLMASAVCTDQRWVPCPGCRSTDVAATSFPKDRIASTTTTPPLTFALRNFCDGTTLQNGMINYGTFWLLVLGVIVFEVTIRQKETQFDEDEQTAQDYSIMIHNPPKDADDPQEWKQFFEQSFPGVHVSCCTVAVDNDLLLRYLVQRRETMKKIENLVPVGTSLDLLTLAGIAAREEQNRSRRGVAWWTKLVTKFTNNGIPELYNTLASSISRIKGLAQLDYDVSRVFITFETEDDQRRVLQAMSVGTIQASRNEWLAVGGGARRMFRGNQVLLIREADEPSTIIWKDFNGQFLDKLRQQIITTLITIGALIVDVFIIRYCYATDHFLAAYIITIFNILFPLFAKQLVSFESHGSHGSKQASLYSKIALFRFANTAIVLTIITHFTHVLNVENGLIDKVRALFYAEISLNVIFQYTGFPWLGHIARHYSAPRAKTQDAMNLHMCGGSVDLAERYTNVTKILFLAVWYSSIYPSGWWLSSLALFLSYYVDRFCFMRSWKRIPKIGTRLSKLSRQYFFPLVLLAMALLSSYFWSAFPFDFLCVMGPIDQNHTDYIGHHRIMDQNQQSYTVSVALTDSLYEHCFQDFLRTRGRPQFPFISKFQKDGDEWMTMDQETVTNIYGWTVVVVIILMLISYIWYLNNDIMSLFINTYKPIGEDQKIPFSKVQAMSVYVPQIKSSVYPYPLLAANVDTIQPKDRSIILDWKDIHRPYSYYDLTKDAEKIVEGVQTIEGMNQRKNKHIFSQIVYWPPPTPTTPTTPTTTPTPTTTTTTPTPTPNSS